ncbi:Bifunctional protein BirA [Mannheimia haemolytica]|uniref:Bifunctional protein BirA n=1 Tax=Mannheimia haemolytica TaxID=75985 RepID=A0A378N2B3_MANHA|nr:Bifunctional protein BirA [Mannheimia haemolytica]
MLETQANRNGLDVVIGIGLNLGMAKVDENIVTQAWADLSQYHFNRNELVCRLAYELQKNLKIYPLVGFAHYAERWQSFDLFRHKAVKLITEAEEITAFRKALTSRANSF